MTLRRSVDKAGRDERVKRTLPRAVVVDGRAPCGGCIRNPGHDRAPAPGRRRMVKPPPSSRPVRRAPPEGERRRRERAERRGPPARACPAGHPGRAGARRLAAVSLRRAEGFRPSSAGAGAGYLPGAGGQSSAAPKRFNPPATNGADGARGTGDSNAAGPGDSTQTSGSPGASEDRVALVPAVRTTPHVTRHAR